MLQFCGKKKVQEKKEETQGSCRGESPIPPNGKGKKYPMAQPSLWKGGSKGRQSSQGIGVVATTRRGETKKKSGAERAGRVGEG